MSDQAERNVIVAMDGSHYSAFAFDWYIRNIHRKGDHVIIVHCREPPSPFIPDPPDPYVLMAFHQDEERKTEELLDSLSARLKNAEIGGKCRSGSGFPGHVIVKIAEEEEASMIITGTRGKGTIRRTFLGSVSDYIIHHAHIPVMVCRDREDVTVNGLPIGYFQQGEEAQVEEEPEKKVEKKTGKKK